MTKRLALAALMIAAPALAQTRPLPAPVPPPASPEAEALGRQLAANGAFATIIGAMSAREIGELADQHPGLDAAARARLRASAAATLARVEDRIYTVIARQYAATMSIEDMRATAAFLATPSAKAWRAAEPGAMMAVAGALDGFDFKKQAWTDYCATPGAACKPAKPK
ncbi:hypothetical protein [Sphingomonas sp.]|jgi:hypothetical protein|uniref:hypothetical protein n=1 Tax=Sphingomonas sp. TaxID=28214 RepID=UPI002E33884C|nr:hypothetical protein [Sphingomonas sp.]HEX4694943.1 hypothetical protein [Sphingomonas sp.]